MKKLDPFITLKDFNFDLEESDSLGITTPILEENIPWNKGLKGTYKNGPLSEEHKKKISDSKKGIATHTMPHTEETKKKISESKKGKPSPNKGKRGKDTSMYGKTQSNKQKAAVSKTGKANKGKKRGPRSAEVKAKIAESQRKRHAAKNI